MEKIRTYAAVAGSFGRDVDACIERIACTLAEARSAGAEMVVFPECALGGPPGPGPGGTLDQPLPPGIRLDGPEVEALIGLSRETVVCLGVSEQTAGGLYSTAVCLSGAGVHGVHRKVHIPPSELRAYCAGESFGAFETPVGRIGMLNCYDKVFPEAARALALQGAGTIVAISAWPVCRERPAEDVGADIQSLHFDLMDQARAVENQVTWISSNLSGPRGDLRYVGQAKVIDPQGRILARTEPGKAGVALASLQPDECRSPSRRAISHLRDRRPRAYGGLPTYGVATA